MDGSLPRDYLVDLYRYRFWRDVGELSPRVASALVGENELVPAGRYDQIRKYAAYAIQRAERAAK